MTRRVAARAAWALAGVVATLAVEVVIYCVAVREFGYAVMR